MIKTQVEYVRFLDKYLNRQAALQPVFPVQLFKYAGFCYDDAEQQLEEYLKADESRTAEEFIDNGVLKVCCPFHFNAVVACDQIGLGEVALARNDYFDLVVLLTRSDQKVEYFFSLLELSDAQKRKVRVIRVKEAKTSLNFYQDLLADQKALGALASALKVAPQNQNVTIQTSLGSDNQDIFEKWRYQFVTRFGLTPLDAYSSVRQKFNYNIKNLASVPDSDVPVQFCDPE